MLNYWCIGCLLISFNVDSLSYAQSITLKEVRVESNRVLHFSSGIKTENIDSGILKAYRNNNMADLLAEQSPVFVKNYGSGGLASTSFRGAGAGHTAVIWNGFAIQSPLNGQIDFSLLPVSSADKVALQYGGTGALWGSGAVGGAVLLESIPWFVKGLKAGLNLAAGSFGQFRQALNLNWGRGRYAGTLKVFQQQANNDFSYYNTLKAGNPLERQRHAQLNQYSLLQENYIQFNEHQSFNFRYWLQSSSRNFSPTMAQLISAAGQKDISRRWTLEWKNTQKKSVWFNRAASFDEKLNYADSLNAIDSKNSFRTLIAESELKYSLSAHHLIDIGINNTYSKAISDGFASTLTQNRISFFGAYTLSLLEERFKATASARQEWFSRQNTAFTYALGGEYQFTKYFGLRASIAKVYRLPTFNDLYWTPGGNPQLLPESGYTEDAGLRVRFISNERTLLSFEPTVFNRTISNWIIWLPGTYYWTPNNIMEVWSRGLETKSTWVQRMKKLDLKTVVLTNYVLSTNQKLKTAGDVSLGKQLIYVPMYSAQASISMGYRNYTLIYNQTYIGYVYTTADHSTYLRPYSLINLKLSKQLDIRDYTFTIYGAVNNLSNVSYQVLASRAMPLHNYQIGINLQLK